MSQSYKQMQELLMRELRLYHFPVAVKFFFDQGEVDTFKGSHDYHTPMRATTFCQWQIAARMKGQVVYGEAKNLGCANAMCSFAWKERDDSEIKSHLKYVRNLAQAQRFVEAKPRLAPGLIGIAVAPLGEAKFTADTVHFYCDNMQAYHLAVDWMAAMDIAPLRANITINSSACGGNVWVFQTKLANMLPACSGGYNAGKTERGEINFILPGEHLEAVVQRLVERMVLSGSASLTRPGDGFPGADICKNCPLIVFKKGQ